MPSHTRLRVNAAPIRASSIYDRADPTMEIAGAGDCLWLADFDAAPPASLVNGAVLPNMARDGTAQDLGIGDGSLVIASGQTLTRPNGGLDFSALTAKGSYAQGPASIAARIRTDGQAFLIFGAIVLPTQDQYGTTTDRATFLTFNTTNPGMYGTGTTEASLVNAAMTWTQRGQALEFGRSWGLNGSNTADSVLHQLQPGDFRSAEPGSGVVIFAMGRHPSLFGADRGGWWTWTRTATQTQEIGRPYSAVSGTAGGDNPSDFSTRTLKLGIGPSGWATVPGTRRNFRLGRAGALTLAGATKRTRAGMIAMLNADWHRVRARGVFA